MFLLGESVKPPQKTRFIWSQNQLKSHMLGMVFKNDSHLTGKIRFGVTELGFNKVLVAAFLPVSFEL